MTDREALARLIDPGQFDVPYKNMLRLKMIYDCADRIIAAYILLPKEDRE
jgi:hypothetical protein